MGIQSANSKNLAEPLSTRQIQILRLMAEGMTTAEIGERLKLNPRTVVTHRELLRGKLGARNAPNTVARGYELGYLGGDR